MARKAEQETAPEGFEGFPIVVGWEWTLACNLECRHCGSSAASARQDELTLDEALKICDQVPDLLVQEVDFTGGEPLLRDDWRPIALHLRDYGIQVKFLTNGLLLDDAMVGALSAAGVSGLGVSIDGMSGTHDAIRGRPGVWEAAIRGVRVAQEAGIPVTVLTTVNGQNVDQLEPLRDRLQQAGVSRWQLQPIFPLGRARSARDLELSDEAYAEFGWFVHEHYGQSDEGPAIVPSDSFGYGTDLDTRDPPWRGCPAGLFSCGITSDGRVKGCLSMPDELSEGSLRDDDLWTIWFSPRSFRYTRGFTIRDLGSNCRDCELGETCRGGCSAMSYGSTGLFHNDPLCLQRISTQCPGVLEAGRERLQSARS